MARTRWRVRMRSWFDATMDRGTPALVGWLGLASLVLIAVITGLVVLLTPLGGGHDGGILTVAWMSLLRTLDPGTMGADQGGPIFLVLMLMVTIGGILIVSSLIGVLTTGINNRITELSKGRSPVLARGHTVLLGWSDQVFAIVAELVKANQANRPVRVVILADRDKIDMQDQLRTRVGDTGRLRVTCRSGNPLKRTDVELVSLDTARSVIVLSPPGEDPDIHVIKALLLLRHRPWREPRPHVVAAVQESRNMPAARLAAGPGGQLVDADDITVRLVVQSHRQTGLSTVYTDLLDFAGNEIYMRAEPALVGQSYGDALHAYQVGCPIGIRRDDGKVALNPPSDTPIAGGDQMIVIAEDETLIQLTSRAAAVMTDEIVTVPYRRPLPDRTLLIGWNKRGPKILDLLDHIAAPGSVVDIAATSQPSEVLDQNRRSLVVGYKSCEPTSRRDLEALDLGSYQHLVVLSDDRFDPAVADDRTLVTLLHLRDIKTPHGDPFAIVTEVNDDANREIAQVTKADDFIVSNRLISLLLAQLAENRHVQAVLADLFDPTAAEILLRRSTEYITTGVAVTFATVIESALRRGETAIGYRLHRNSDQPPAYGVVINPAKTELITFEAHDSVIVVGKDAPVGSEDHRGVELLGDPGKLATAAERRETVGG